MLNSRPRLRDQVLPARRWWAGALCRRARYRLSEGHAEEAARLAERALVAMSPRAGSDPRYVQALEVAADALETLGRYREARPLREDVVAALGEDPVPVAVATACLRLGNLLRVLAEYRQAEPMLARAVAAANRSGDDRLQAEACNALGILCKDTGRYEEAERHYRRACTLLEASGSHAGALASVWHNLAGLAYARGAYAEGERTARVAVEMRESVVGRNSPEAAAETWPCSRSSPRRKVASTRPRPCSNAPSASSDAHTAPITTRSQSI